MQALLRQYNIVSPLYITLYGAVVMGIVYIFQYGFGYQPCQLCVWQRFPWSMVILLGAVAYLAPLMAKKILYICTFILFIGMGIAIFQAGVEYGFWTGLSSCGGSTQMLSGSALLNSLETQIAPQCDTASWTLFGVSMAGYNAIISLDAGIFTFLLARLQK